MIRKLWLPTAILVMVLMVGTSIARTGSPLPWYLDLKQGHRFGPAKAITGEEEINPNIQVSNYTPGRDEMNVAIGEVYTYGYTWYDYQHNGSVGKMVVRDAQGGLHFVYMKGYDSQQNTRHTFYNFLSEDGDWLLGPNDAGVVDAGTRSGYACVDILPEDNRGMPFYHVLGHLENDRNYTATAQSADFMRGFGAFSPSYPPAWAQVTLIWPKGAISRNNFTHILSTENGPEGQVWQRVAYWRGEPDRGFENWRWLDPPINVDTTAAISGVVAASRTSNKVAMAWHHNRVGSNRGPWEAFGGAYQRNNDLRYIVSDNGRDFNWQNGIKSMTKIIPVSPELVNFDPTAALGDTFRPYCDVDIQFDPWGQDGLYASFAANGFWENPEPGGDPITGMTGEHNYLWFWNAQGGNDGEDTITFVFDGWYFNRTNNGGAWRSRTGAWRMNADRPSIAFDPQVEGKIYLVWVNFPHIQDLNPDYNADPENQPPFFYNEFGPDTSGAGYSNAEIMVSISTDYGITWRQPINITDTKWLEDRAPDPGQCQSENWASVAVWADDALHITYVKDLDAGGVIQTPAEGVATNSPMVYHRVPLDELRLNDPVVLPSENFIFHNYPAARPQIDERLVSRNPGVPTPNAPVQVTATVLPGGNNELSEVLLLYALDGGEERSVPMVRVQGDIWGGAIPGQADGVTVWYRVQATNNAGLSTIVPLRVWRWAYTVRPEGGLQIRDIQYRPSQWEVDYSPYRGYEVTVTGIVTTPASFAQNMGAYAIQDASAGWSGVFVRGINQDLNVGDRLRVTGTVFERDPNDPVKWEYATYINVASFEVVGQGQVPNPILVGGVNELTYARRAEELEGVLTRLIDFEIDTLSGINPVTTQYWPITDRTGEGWMTTIGLSEGTINELGIRNMRQGSTITQMVGVFTENNGHYALAPRSADDIGSWSAPDNGRPTPMRFALHPAFPNPFNARTSVSFDLPSKGWARLAVYDLAGRLVADLIEGDFNAGRHSLLVDATELPTGIYLMRLESAGQVATRKLALVK